MLVLGRTKDESIVIKVPPSDVQRDIKIMVVRVEHGRNVRLGVDAEKDIVILRSELEERK